jgi:hypothetical protein
MYSLAGPHLSSSFIRVAQLVQFIALAVEHASSLPKMRADGCAVQVKLNKFLSQENSMFEDYLRRVHPNMDRSGTAEAKQGSKKKKRSEVKKESVQPLTAEEKANICSHQLDYILQKIGDVERKGQDEISEVACLYL